MKLLIINDYSNSDCLGEFIKPNILKIYISNCNECGANSLYIVIHEYTHYFIHNYKLSWLFNKLNKLTIDKCIKEGIRDVDIVHNRMAEERFCNFIASRICRKY